MGADGDINEQRGLEAGRQIIENCEKSEMAIREQLVQQWPTFTATEQTNCIGKANAGGLPSYTDLITCLQMARGARKLGE